MHIKFKQVYSQGVLLVLDQFFFQPVWTSAQNDCLLFNDKLIQSYLMEQGCLLHVQVDAAVAGL